MDNNHYWFLFSEFHNFIMINDVLVECDKILNTIKSNYYYFPDKFRGVTKEFVCKSFVYSQEDRDRAVFTLDSISTQFLDYCEHNNDELEDKLKCIVKQYKENINNPSIKDREWMIDNFPVIITSRELLK